MCPAEQNSHKSAQISINNGSLPQEAKEPSFHEKRQSIGTGRDNRDAGIISQRLRAFVIRDISQQSVTAETIIKRIESL